MFSDNPATLHRQITRYNERTRLMIIDKQATLKYVFKCVNSYAIHVEALREIRQMKDNTINDKGYLLDTAIEIARQALKDAEEA